MTKAGAPHTLDRTEEAPRPALSDAQLAELLSLLKGVDSAELKMSVPEELQRSTVAALGMDPLDAEIRQVAFFDTPDLALDRHGLVVRARRVQRKPGDVVVKLRPVVPDALPTALRRAPGFGIEVDAMPGGFVCSAAMQAEVASDDVRAVIAGQRSIRKLCTKAQRALFADRAPDGIELDDLSVLGPVTVLKLKFVPADLQRRLVAELWIYPDGSRILELSTKCAPADIFTVAAEVRAYLGERGVRPSGPQRTKTRAALEYFSAQLAPVAAS